MPIYFAASLSYTKFKFHFMVGSSLFVLLADAINSIRKKAKILNCIVFLFISF